MSVPVALANPADVSVSSGTLYYSAGPGETNNLTITYTGTAYNVTDSGATITPGTGCTSTGPNSATCSSTGIDSVNVDLDDLNDMATANVPVDTYLNGDTGNDTLTGGAAGDNIYGGEGDDTLDGGAGQDYVQGESGNDTLTGGAARDSIYGGEGDDTLDGGAGDDYIQGESGNDTLRGGAASDDIDGGAGNDDMRGGDGTDLAYYYGRSGDVTLSFDDSPGDGETASGESDNVHSDIEDAGTGDGNDTITGSARPNSFYASAGDDSVNGAGGNDDLYGATGDDLLSGGNGDDSFRQEPGSDTYAGGAGSDFIEYYYYTNENVTVRLNNTADDGSTDEGDNIRSDVEEVATGGGDDTLIGNNAANYFSSGAGSDVLNGGGGSDGLDGERGDDRITGGSGVDSVHGGSGGDTIAIKDKSRDYAECGGGVDTVRRDRRDLAQRDCERIGT